MRKKSIHIKWDLLGLRRLKRISHYIESQFHKIITLNPSEDEHIDRQLEIHFYDLEWMASRKPNRRLRRSHRKCKEQIDFFIKWRIWQKEYQKYKEAEADSLEEPENLEKLNDMLVQLTSLKRAMVFLKNYAHFKKVRIKTLEIQKELE